MFITVNKIGDGSNDNPIRPNTTAKWWQVVTEKENDFDIEILEE